MFDLTAVKADSLREWQYVAWMCNDMERLVAYTAELRRRGERSHAFFGGAS